MEIYVREQRTLTIIRELRAVFRVAERIVTFYDAGIMGGVMGRCQRGNGVSASESFVFWITFSERGVANSYFEKSGDLMRVADYRPFF